MVENLLAIVGAVNMNITMSWETILTIIFFMVVHLCGTVWWMAKIQTTLQILITTVDSINSRVSTHEAKYYSKEEAAKDFSYRDQQIEALWRRVDSTNNNIN